MGKIVGNVRFRVGTVVLGLCVLYGLMFVFLSGEVLSAPRWLLFLYAAILIWISVEDLFRLSFPLSSILALTVASGVLAWFLGVNLLVNLCAGLAYFALFFIVDKAVSSGKDHPALGLGDSLLIFCSGLLLGPFDPLQVTLVASVLGIVWVGVNGLRTEGYMRAPLPFGPFLSFGIWLTLLEPGLLIRFP